LLRPVALERRGFEKSTWGALESSSRIDGEKIGRKEKGTAYRKRRRHLGKKSKPAEQEKKTKKFGQEN